MKIIKRNQIIIFVIALMLVTSGYMSLMDLNDKEEIETSSIEESIGDATLVSSSELVAEDDEQEKVILNAISIDEQEDAVNIVENDIDEYFINSKIERDNMYSQVIESYQKMINSTSITAEQKAIAQNEITKINNIKNAIMIIENLIETKGFKNAVVLVNDDSVNIIIGGEELTSQQVAQIQNIVSRELKADIDNIHISNKS